MVNWTKYDDDEELSAQDANAWARDHGLAHSHLPHAGKKVTIKMLRASLAKQQGQSAQQQANRVKKQST